MRFDAQPLGITETRLLPPPCRRSRTEANLLRDMRKMFQARVSNFHQIVQAYKNEAAKLEIFNPTVPEQWELICQETLSPKLSGSPRKWLTVQDELWNTWAADHGLTLQSMVDERAEFSRRHSGDLATLAQVRYRMEFNQRAVTVWLSVLNFDKPKAVSDLNEIEKLLAARPELFRLTPDEAEKELGLKPDAKHRIFKQYCKAAKLDFKKITRADLTILLAVRDDRKNAQSRAAIRVNMKRLKNS